MLHLTFIPAAMLYSIFFNLYNIIPKKLLLQAQSSLHISCASLYETPGFKQQSAHARRILTCHPLANTVYQTHN